MVRAARTAPSPASAGVGVSVHEASARSAASSAPLSRHSTKSASRTPYRAPATSSEPLACTRRAKSFIFPAARSDAPSTSTCAVGEASIASISDAYAEAFLIADRQHLNDSRVRKDRK